MTSDILKIAALTLIVTLLLAAAPMSFAADKSAGQRIDETAQSIRNFSAEQRDDALKSAKKILDDADARIDQFEREVSKNWDKMNASARKHAQETLRAMRQQRQDLSQSYGELKRSSAKAWDEVKGGFSKSYEALRDSFSKAAKEF